MSGEIRCRVASSAADIRKSKRTEGVKPAWAEAGET